MIDETTVGLVVLGGALLFLGFRTRKVNFDPPPEPSSAERIAADREAAAVLFRDDIAILTDAAENWLNDCEGVGQVPEDFWTQALRAAIKRAREALKGV